MTRSFAATFRPVLSCALALGMAGVAAPALAAPGGGTQQYASYYYQSEPSSSSAPSQTSSYDRTAPAAGDASSNGWFDNHDWDITLGLGVGIAPKYPGADTHLVLPQPMVSIVYRKNYFINENGAGANLWTWHNWKAGIMFDAESGRDNTDNARLHYLSDIAPSLNGGGYVSYQLDSIELRTAMRHAITHASSYGTSGEFSATYRGSIMPGTLDFSGGPEIGVADTDYMKTWFGVPADRGAMSGMAAYKPTWGVKDVGVNGSVTYHYSPHVLLRTYVGIKELVGDASDSPLSAEDTEVSAGLGVAYHF